MPFRIIPVIDLCEGLAVHARGGDRSRYQPVVSAIRPDATPGDPLALARALRVTFGATECYVADLDAIRRGTPQLSLIAELADPRRGFGPNLLLDAGASDAEFACTLVDAGAGAVVVGLESLPSFSHLAGVAAAIGAERTVFSLDLRNGVPLRQPADAGPGSASPERLIRRALEVGAGSVIALDLGRVGTGQGVDLDLLRRLRNSSQPATLIAGGGIRTVDDLAALERLGYSGALVASAIHSGAVRHAAREAP